MKFESISALIQYIDKNPMNDEEVPADPAYEFTENDVMYFGKYKGKKLGDIPETYFVWLWKNGLSSKMTCNRDGKLARYINNIVKNM